MRLQRAPGSTKSFSSSAFFFSQLIYIIHIAFPPSGSGWLANYRAYDCSESLSQRFTQRRKITKVNDVVSLRQTSYIDKMVESYLPDGVPDSFKSTETACKPELPQLVTDVLASDVEPSVAIVGCTRLPCTFCATSTDTVI